MEAGQTDCLEVENVIPLHKAASLLAMRTTLANESISERRERSISALLFDRIVGEKLKCYEKWKLWFTLFVIMSVIAVGAIVLATYLAVEHSKGFGTPSEAITAEHQMIEALLSNVSANASEQAQAQSANVRPFNMKEEVRDEKHRTSSTTTRGSNCPTP